METGKKIAKLFVVVMAVYLGIKFILPVALPFLLALILARFLYPLARIFETKGGLKRTTARFMAYGIFLVVVGSVAAGLLYLCYRMGISCFDHAEEVLEKADRIFGSCCSRLEEVLGFGTDEIQKTISKEAENLAGGAVEYSKEAGWYMVGLLAKIFITFIAAFLILNDYETIRKGIGKTQAGKYAEEIYHEMKTASGAYILAQLRIMGTVTAVCIAGLFLLRIPHALWLGLAIGIFDALPFFGTGTIFVPWALVELLIGKYVNALGFFLIYIICNFIRQILEPRLLGKQLGVPPLAVLASVYIGIHIYGAAGVITGPVSALLIYEISRKLL